MLIKKRTKPLPLQKLDALISRLHPNHPNLENIKKDAAIRYKGYIGEQKVDYHLERLTLPCTIAHDIYIKTEQQNFQIDTLILTQRAIYIIEIKNYTGTITFDTNLQQFIRKHDTKEEGFHNPITQAENTQHQLQQWLTTKNIRNIPIHYFIVISEPSTIIRVHGNEQSIAKTVTHTANLTQKITTTEQSHKNNNLNHRKIGHIITQASQQFDLDITRQHNITPHDIRPGVQCPNCKQHHMKRQHSKWHCTKCHHTSKHAHITALNDYLLLIKPYITNRNTRNFLKIQSRYQAKRLLQSANLTYNQKLKAWQKNN